VNCRLLAKPAGHVAVKADLHLGKIDPNRLITSSSTRYSTLTAIEVSNWSDEETDEPLIADHRNFYKVEKWSRDGQRVTELLFAGSSLDKAKSVFDRWAKHRPRIRITVRQRTRVNTHHNEKPQPSWPGLKS
jgi:hypothetical protein